LWLAAGPALGTEAGRALASRAAADPREFFIALRGDEPIARLRGVVRSPTLYVLRELVARDDVDFDPAALALVECLQRSFSGADTELLAWGGADTEPVNDALARAGCVLIKTKCFVERSLVGYVSRQPALFAYRTLETVGEDEFIAIMARAAVGDPFEDVTQSNPREDFNELVAYAGKAFDPVRWRVAYLDDEPVGVVLPQPYPKSPLEGTLFYVAVLPSFRGRGYGTGLHAAGLAFLAEQGLTRYVGSTDVRNTAMMRAFERNGCKVTGTQFFFSLGT
jgi:RimJ/RimL family protein N-acetyltransferase